MNSPSLHVCQALVGASLLTTLVDAQGGPSPGLTLTAEIDQKTTRLIDETGAVVHAWTSPSMLEMTAYLLDDGSILRSERPAGAPFGPGSAGRVRRIAWDGAIEWEFDYFGGGVLPHHDIEPMPNGNVLMIVWEDIPKAAAVSAGRNPALTTSIFQPDHILEVQPTGPASGAVVWEWHAMDHLIQDFDPGAANFGVVADHPELIDVNYPPIAAGDWMHSNSISYNAELDQILISVRSFDEVWVIDHSTTTVEAAGHTGGSSGKGGDLLYRWGNPEAYDTGPPAARVLGGQHDTNWVPAGYPGAGNIVIFNNFAGTTGGPFGQYSSIVEITPPIDGSGNYTVIPGQPFGPIGPAWEYTAPVPSNFFTGFAGGGVSRLANGNTLVSSPQQLWIFELNPSGTIVWQDFGSGRVYKPRRHDRSLWATSPKLSASAGGTVELQLEAGVGRAADVYLVLGSFTGTSPGTVLDGHELPLNVLDPYFAYTLTYPNVPPLANSLGVLDALGGAQASFNVAPAALATALIGLDVHHAYAALDLTIGQVTWASNAAVFSITP